MKKILCILYGCFLVFSSSHAQRRLTVEETLLFIKRDYVDVIPKEAIETSKNANPAVRPILYQILRDTNQMNIWSKAMGAFAYLGQKEDVSKIEQFIEERKEQLKIYEYNTIIMTFIVLGELNNRGITEAKILHKKMLTWNYWDSLNLKYYSTIEEDKLFQQEIILRALNGYAYSHDSDFYTIADTVYKELNEKIIAANRKSSLQNEMLALRNEIKGIKEFYNEIEAQKIRK